MLYPIETDERGKKLRVVDLCKWIDEHAYTNMSDEEIEKFYRRIYFVAYSIAKNKRYFNSEEEYDDFSSFAAVEAWNRYNNEKQFTDPPTMERLKSIKNYFNRILFGLRFDYTIKWAGYQEVVGGECDSKWVKKPEPDLLCNFYKNNASYQNKEKIKSLMIDTLKDIPSTVKRILKDSPYRKDKSMMKNIYLSCLLTLLSHVTPINNTLEKLERAREVRENVDLSSFRFSRDDNILLWRLPIHMRDYVSLMVKKAENILKEDIKDILGTYQLTKKELEDVIQANYPAYITKELVDNA